MGNDGNVKIKVSFPTNFNPRSRVGNDPVTPIGQLIIKNFNPRSRVGNDLISSTVGKYNFISIHVPAWGTTLFVVPSASVLIISIHVPAWGTTQEWDPGLNRPLLFQSTFPRGERQGDFEWRAHIQDFNPRSRVGNDLSIPQVSIYNIQFQSTFPRGERRYFKIRELRKRQFQSTFPRGERRCKNWIYSVTENFNPRSRVGNDKRRSLRRLGWKISIHVPAWGTTPANAETGRTEAISIHVPAWGTTPNDSICNTLVTNFNPRSRVGNDGEFNALPVCGI